MLQSGERRRTSSYPVLNREVTDFQWEDRLVQTEFKSSPLVQPSVMPPVPLDLKRFPCTFLHYFGVRSFVRMILDVWGNMMTEMGNGREGRWEFLSRRGQKLLFCLSSLPAMGKSHFQIPAVPFGTKYIFVVNVCVLSIERATCHPASA